MLGLLVQQMVNGPKPKKPVVKPSGPPLCRLCPPDAKRERLLLSSGRRTTYCREHNKEVCSTNYKLRQKKLKEAGL